MANAETITDNDIQLCPLAPAWGQLMVWEVADKKPKAPPNWGDRPPVQLDLKNLDSETVLWWDGIKFAAAPNGQPDRSTTLFTIGRLLAKQGYDGPAIISALADRDAALGYRKFCDRKDGGMRAYTDIAVKVTAPSNRTPSPKASTEARPPKNPELCQYQEQVKLGGGALGPIIRKYLETQRDVLVAYYKKRADLPSLRRADRVENCFTNYIEWVCQTTKLTFVRRFKCGDINCPLCSFRLLHSFFKDKEEILRKHLTTPAVYRMYLGPSVLPSEEGARDLAVRALYKQVNVLMNHLRDNLESVLDIAVNNARGLRCNLIGNTMHRELVLLGNQAPDTRVRLEKFFKKELGAEVLVFEERCVDVQQAMEEFRGLMAIRVVWDNPRDYEIWRGATKGMKLIQGRGVLYRITGSRPPKLSSQEATHLYLNCEVCGDCRPVAREGVFYPVETTRVVQKHSPWTGKTYSVIAEGGGTVRGGHPG